jgi:hypothetical protein
MVSLMTPAERPLKDTAYRFLEAVNCILFGPSSN